jgi:LysM repeat protein
LTVYDFLHAEKQPWPHHLKINQEKSWLARKPEVDKPAGKLAGLSRAWGDVTPDVHKKIIDLLIEIATRYKLPYRDIAHLLLMCKVESGFNPDAATPSSSAAGLSQFLDVAAKEALRISKKRLGFTLDVSGSEAFDAEKGAFAAVLSYMMCKERSVRDFQGDYEKYLYVYHHESWYWHPSPEHIAAVSKVTDIIKKSITPYLNDLEKLLSQGNTVSLKLVTKDDQPYKDQPYVALYPSASKPKDAPIVVQGAATKDVKWTVGKTDGQGKTAPVSAPALSEVVFVILNKDYKDFLDANSSSGETSTHTVEKGDSLSKIAKENGTTVEQLQLINHIANPNQIVVGQTIVTHQGDYVCRKPEIDDIAPFLQSALNASSNAAPAVVEHAASHILLPEGNKAQTHEGEEKVIVMKGGKTADQAAAQKKLEEVPHKTVKEDVKKVVQIPPVVADKPLLRSCKTGDICLKKGDKHKLIKEINVRLAGFGGALPTEEFTDLTEKCVKQFQKDYMKAAETGRVCGNFLQALDGFMNKFPVAKYFSQMKCTCGKCGGFGNGRMHHKFTVTYFKKSAGKTVTESPTANEFPGMHRSIMWVLRAAMHYTSTIDSGLNYSVRGINSGYRCVDDNLKHSRPTINHMGKALDIGFKKGATDLHGGMKGVSTDMDTLREKVFVPHMGATIGAKTRQFGNNKIWLEGCDEGALSWVHADVTSWEGKYATDDLFAQTADDADGGSIVEIARIDRPDLVGCPGNC